jgi:hypothetical protein
MEKTDTVRDVKLDYDFGKQVCVAIHPPCSPSTRCVHPPPASRPSSPRNAAATRYSRSVRTETTTTAPHPTPRRATALLSAFLEGAGGSLSGEVKFWV